MILSHDQIKDTAKCLDCARRNIDIVLCPDFGDLHDAIEGRFDACIGHLAEDIAHAAPFNLVVIEHDPGCPRATQRLADHIKGEQHAHGIAYRTAEMQICSVDLPEDHPWVLKASEDKDD